MKNDSVINHPKFKKWVRDFDFKNPKFLEEIDRRSKTSKAYISALKKAQRVAERKSDAERWVPIRNGKERV